MMLASSVAAEAGMVNVTRTAAKANSALSRMMSLHKMDRGLAAGTQEPSGDCGTLAYSLFHAGSAAHRSWRSGIGRAPCAVRRAVRGAREGMIGPAQAVNCTAWRTRCGQNFAVI